MTHAAPHRSAFTLIELLCVMVLLILAGTMLTLLLRDTLRIERIQAAGFERLVQSKALADQFRADVAQAEAEEQQWNDFQADETTLILRFKNKAHIVYRWQEATLTRRVFEPDVDEQSATLPVGGKQVDVEFVHAGKEHLVRLRLHPQPDGKRTTGKALEFVAALGGNWR